MLNRTLKGSDHLRLRLKDSRHPFDKRGLGFNRSNTNYTDKTKNVKIVRPSSDTSTSRKNEMHTTNK